MVGLVKEASQAIFYERLKVIENIAGSRDLLLDTNLFATKRSGVQWVLLCIAKPFATLLCQDVFFHVRINHVMDNFRRYLHENADYLTEADTIYVTDKIITPLKAKAGAKHPSSFSAIYFLFHCLVERRSGGGRWARDEQRWMQLTDSERTAVMNYWRVASSPASNPTPLTLDNAIVYQGFVARFGDTLAPPFQLQNY